MPPTCFSGFLALGRRVAAGFLVLLANSFSGRADEGLGRWAALETGLNWEALGAFGEVAGAFAVVASLLFVGYQLRQGQSIERAKAQRDLLIQARDWMSLLAADEERFEAVRSCLNDFDNADDFTKERFNAWGFNMLLIFEQVHYMHIDGFVNDGSFYRFEQVILAIFRTRGGAQWWKLAFDVVGTDVGDYLASRLEEIGDSVTPWNELLPHLQAKARAAQQAD